MRTSSQAVPTPPAASAATAAFTSSAYLWWAMTSIVLGGYISVLTNHVMNMVLPKMMRDLGTDVITIRWVVTAYMIANAGVIALLIACCLMHRSPRKRGVPFDWWGVLTLSTAMVALLLALSNGQREGWDSTPIVSLWIIFAVALGIFLLVEPHATTQALQALDQEALLLAFNDAFSTFVLISLCGLVLGLFFRRARAR